MASPTGKRFKGEIYLLLIDITWEDVAVLISYTFVILKNIFAQIGNKKKGKWPKYLKVPKYLQNWQTLKQTICNLVQTNLAEFKAQEIAKLQNSLEEMKRKVDETNALLLMERENAKKAIEVTSPVIKEAMVLVEDKEKIKRLRMEVDNLKVKLDILIC
jgi:hypothetical protein